MRPLTLPLLLLLLAPTSASASCQAGSGEDSKACAFQIRIATAKYGSQDQWCSGMSWVQRNCSGQWICSVALPERAVDGLDADGRKQMRREAICGPVNATTKALSIGWYCSDGVTFLGQPTVTLFDGERAMLSCSQP